MCVHKFYAPFNCSHSTRIQHLFYFEVFSSGILLVRFIIRWAFRLCARFFFVAKFCLHIYDSCDIEAESLHIPLRASNTLSFHRGHTNMHMPWNREEFFPFFCFALLLFTFPYMCLDLNYFQLIFMWRFLSLSPSPESTLSHLFHSVTKCTFLYDYSLLIIFANEKWKDAFPFRFALSLCWFFVLLLACVRLLCLPFHLFRFKMNSFVWCMIDMHLFSFHRK